MDRFYPVLYPKVTRCDVVHVLRGHDSVRLTGHLLSSRPQASRLIVTFDEHVISNNFKFGVIYQKFGQVSAPGR